MSGTSHCLSNPPGLFRLSSPASPPEYRAAFIMDDSTTCSICQSPKHQPKLLPCSHSFCAACLDQYVPAESLSVTCPACRATSILPLDGVKALPDFSNGVHENGVPGCAHHQADFTHYCSTCETSCCERCLGSEHKDHGTVPIEQNRQDVETCLRSMLEESEGKVNLVKESLKKIDSVCDSLEVRHGEAETQLYESFHHLEGLLNSRREKLLGDLKSMHERKQATLKHQVSDLQKSLKELELCREDCEQALASGNEKEIISAKSAMAEKLKTVSPSKKSLLPDENDFLFFFDKDIRATEKHIANFGKVRSNSAVSFETTASGEGLKQCYTAIAACVTVTTKDCGSDLVTVGYAMITASMKHVKSGEAMRVEVVDNLNGTYDVIYTTTENGPFELEILMMGAHIRGSPFYILSVAKPDGIHVQPAQPKPRAKSKTRSSKRSSSRSRGSYGRKNPLEDDLVDRIGKKGRNKGEFMNPQGVCATEDKIIVADSSNQCVQVLGKDGSVKLKFGLRGRNPGQMQRPICPAVTNNGNYLISDYDNAWVSVFSPEGKYLNKFGTGRLVGPKGLAVNRSNGQIVVVDNKASCIFVFQSNGKFLHKFGSRGNADYQLAGPHYVAVGGNNEIIVSDFHNHCIKMFSWEGGYLYSFGSNGEGNGQFNAPTGVATDNTGNILVADWGNSRIQVFDSTGSFLSYINTSADALYGPQGISVTSDGFVIAADSGNHCVKVYKYLQ